MSLLSPTPAASALRPAAIEAWLASVEVGAGADPTDAAAPGGRLSAAQVAAELDALIASRRGGLLSFVGKATRAMRQGNLRQPPSCADLATAGLTLAELVRADKRLDLGQLLRAGIVASVEDLVALGLATFGDLLRAAAPSVYALQRCAPSDAAWERLVGDLVRAGWWSPQVWLQHAGELGPKDLWALGVTLSDWFAADATLLAAAQKCKAAWLPQADAKSWLKYAGLTGADLARLGGAGPTHTRSSSSSAINQLLVTPLFS